MPTLLPPPMPITPRDAPPPAFSPTPRAPSARNAPPPVFVSRPLPPILPDFPLSEIVLPKLIWLTDENQLTSASVETYGLLPVNSQFQTDGKVLAVAAFIGEASNVVWTTTWTPDQVGGYAPGLIKDFQHLIIYCETFTASGILEVQAAINHVTYGPLVLNVMTNRIVDAAKIITANQLGSL